MRTAHMADERGRTVCGIPWEDWQHPDQGASLEEALAVPGLTLLEKGEIREADRARYPQAGEQVQLCQACGKRAGERAR